MKKFRQNVIFLICHGLAIISFPSQAQQTTPNVGSFGVNTNPNRPIDNPILKQIRDELLYLGYYLGYPLDSKDAPKAPSQPTLPSNLNNLLGLESMAVKSLFTALSSSLLQTGFIPSNKLSDFGGYAAINTLANAVLTNIYTPNAVDAPWSGSKDDQLKNPPSPVSQMVLNLLSNTADEQCFIPPPSTNSNWSSNCSYAYTTSFIFAEALGLTHGTSANDFFSNPSQGINQLAKSLTSNGLVGSPTQPNNLFPSSSGNPQILYLAQVDSSSFLSPLVYSSDQDKKISPPPFTNADTSSQTSAAQAFLRNVTGNIMPSEAPAPQTFSTLLNSITTSQDINTQLSSFKLLGKYLLGSRIFAAQESVAYQNIYEIMAKRMPYTDPNGTNDSQPSSSPANPNPSSQALNEFIMASYRLYNPQGDGNSQGGSPSPTPWQNKIATTSSLNVEREIAVLLAELNYQLYLMRQQQERLVMTDSIILLNLLRAPTLNASQ